MTNRKNQPELAVPKIEGQPYHPDPDVMAKLTKLDATDPLPKPRRQKRTTAVTRPTTLDRQASADQRPYTLESANLEQELDRQRRAALSEIEAVEAEILSITLRAANDVAAIQSRAEAEITGRKQRTTDLQRIIDMADRALTPPPNPTEAAQQAVEDDMAARRAATAIAAHTAEGNDQ